MTSKDNCHVEAPAPPTPLDILCRQALARSQDDFEALFNTINDLLFVLDPDGVMIYVNQVACRRLGYGEAELVGRPFLSIYSPDLRDEAARLVTAMPADFCLVPIVARDGTEIPVETRIVQGEWNGKLALFGVVKDMSLLKQSEELFSWSFHSNPVLMAVSSLSDDRFIKVNEVFLTTLGYPLSKVVGKTAGELRIMVDPCTRAEVHEMLEREGRARGVETRVRCKDGTIRHGLFSADRIMSGNAPCLLTTMVDITPLKQT
ncbi:MAG: PAS domain-containing protein, partial [Deltaproteobacteria bacterium]